MPRDFFGISDDDSDDSAMEQFSLPKGLRVKRKPAAKKPSVKRASAKRASAKRGSAKRVSAKRGSAKRVSAKRGSPRRSSPKRVSSKRKTSRPVQAAARPVAAPRPAAEVRRVSIPRPAAPARPEPLVALPEKLELPPARPFGGPQARPVEEAAPAEPPLWQGLQPVAPENLLRAAQALQARGGEHDYLEAVAALVNASIRADADNYERKYELVCDAARRPHTGLRAAGGVDAADIAREVYQYAQIFAKEAAERGASPAVRAHAEIADQLSRRVHGSFLIAAGSYARGDQNNALRAFTDRAADDLRQLRKVHPPERAPERAPAPAFGRAPVQAPRPAFGAVRAEPRKIRPQPLRAEMEQELSKLPFEMAKPGAMPGAPTEAPYGLNREGLGNKREMGVAWTKILKLLPVTMERLGIKDEIRSGAFATRWLGSGAFATAFSMPDPSKVFKMTTDVEDLHVLKLLAEGHKALPGLLHVYEVFRAELPFAVGQTKERRLQAAPVSEVYGIVTERAVTLSDYTKGKNLEPMVEQAAAALGDSRRARRLLAEAVSGTTEVVDRIYRDLNDGLKTDWRAISRMSEYGQELANGREWAEDHRIEYRADAHHGNFAIVWRDGRFQAVKSDLGFHSVKEGIEYAREEAKKLPLAANRHWSED